MALLEIRDLHAAVEGKEILKGVNLTVKTGEIHSIMGPNGSGKSTLASVIMGHPKYKVTKGEVLLDGENVLAMLPDERARKGLFLAFQNPVEVPGVSVTKFLYNAYSAVHKSEGTGKTSAAFPEILRQSVSAVGLDESFAKRQLNAGFSGGEKKRGEVLQMQVLKPKISILDEIDSGLDIDALKAVSISLKAQQAKGTGMLVITHYQRILKHLNPDFVHVMVDGRIVKSGGHELAADLENSGYAGLLKGMGISFVEDSGKI
ncbi:TPA: Fe-S cluster assembly ATPase SufC [Candidatus Micrarchaeota archaeon]|nr:Fe-S cluster assembly ATPase SufC [Candidatus Micrarchaeota archaeon]